MNAAYFSTATAMGSCNSYSRFTISGGLLMIDICSSPLFFFLCPNSTRAKHMANRGFPCSLGWSDRHGFRGNEVGSLQPSFVFCPCPKSIVASCATSAFPTTSVHRGGERNGEPQSEPRRSCAVHPVPVPFVEGRSPVPDEIGVKENCPFRCQL